jgi:hypothetical protein
MSVTQALSAALIQFLWQGSMVGFLLWVTLVALRKQSANAKYVVSCVALAILAVLPLVTTALLWRRALPMDASTRAFMDIPRTIAPSWTASAAEGTAWLRWLERWVLPVWSFGVLLFSVRFACGCQHSAGVVRVPTNPC